MALLRFFLFLDDRIVAQFLEQLDLGEYGDEQINRQRQSGGSIDGSLRAGPAGVGAGYSRAVSEDSAVVRRPTAASRFARLYEELQAQGAIQSLDVADDGIWDQLQVGEIIESTVTLAVPEIFRVLSAIPEISKLMPMFEQIASISADDGSEQRIDPREVASVKGQLPFMAQAAEIVDESPLPVLARLASDERYAFHLQMKRSFISVGADELSGEARMLAKIQRKVEKGKPEVIHLLLPEVMPRMNRAQRRGSAKGSEAGKSFTVDLRYPSAIMTPIAIYR
jgi:hypothetical protein